MNKMEEGFVKAFCIPPQRKPCICNFNNYFFNESLTNGLVHFEQPMSLSIRSLPLKAAMYLLRVSNDIPL